MLLRIAGKGTKNKGRGRQVREMTITTDLVQVPYLAVLGSLILVWYRT